MGAYNRQVIRRWLAELPEKERAAFLSRLDPFWRERLRRRGLACDLMVDRLVLLAMEDEPVREALPP